MPMSVETIALLTSHGIVGEALVEVARAIEKDFAPVETRSPNAIRQARYRERKATEAVTEAVTFSVTSPPPKETPRTPIETTPSRLSLTSFAPSTDPEPGSLDLFGSIETIKASRAKPADTDLILEIVDIWNTEAQRLGLPQVQDITPKRQGVIRARVRDFPAYDFADPLQGFRQLMVRVRGSPFLTGATKEGFRADFDFVTRSEKFHRIMEGSYEAKKPEKPDYNGNGRHGGSVNGFGRHFG